MVKHPQHSLFPIALLSIVLTGCAAHQDLLAPANTGPMKPVNTSWTAANKVPEKEKQTPAQDQ